jgi:outer membrane receptor protein involved in Fe transport
MHLRRTHLSLILSFIATPSIATPIVPAEPGVEEMVVQGRKSDYSVITENAQKIIDVPGSLGDPLMAVFSLPGVLSEGDGGGAPAVRGSSPSDNLYLVDGAPAGYVFHAFSTSIFNENIIQDFELFSAGFGPRYGSAIGGVFDIKLRDPRDQALATKVDVSFLRAGLFAEGAVSENSAFYLSARSSLLQYFYDADEAEEEDGIKVQDAPEDTDYQFKYQYRIGDHHKLTLSANGATDLAAAEFTESSTEVMEDPDFAGDAKIENSFNNQALRWQFDSGSGSLLDVQIGHYLDNADTFWGSDKYFFELEKEDAYVLVDYSQALGAGHTLSLGAQSHASDYNYRGRFINYVCTEFDPDCALRRGELLNVTELLKVEEHQGYINDHWQITDRFALDLGVHGHYNDLTEESFAHPRAALAWEFIDDWTLSASGGRYNRLPDIDKVLPSFGNPKLKSPTSDHYTVGIKQELDDGWSWSVTSYYKTMEQLPLASDVDDTRLPPYTNNTEGEAYGVDVFINKDRIDRWYGWLAISASRSTRTNQLTNVERDYYLDTPLVVNAVINYQLTDDWNIGTRLTAQSGRAITPITGIQPNPYFENYILPVYGEAYSDNLPTYTRIDLRAQRKMSLFGIPGTYNLDALNLLNRQNVSDRRLDYKRSKESGQLYLEDEVGMGIILSAGLTLNF